MARPLPQQKEALPSLKQLFPRKGKQATSERHHDPHRGSKHLLGGSCGPKPAWWGPRQLPCSNSTKMLVAH